MCLTRTAYGIVLGILVFISSCAQTEKKDVSPKTEQTKMEEFISARGTILRFEDYNLSAIKTRFGGAETRIRKISSGNDNRYFYQIEKKGEYRSEVASIEYSDLIEVIKSLPTLKSQFGLDVERHPDYLESKFKTVDEFTVGYYVTAAKASWYIRLSDGTDATIFIDNVEQAEKIFLEGKAKIESLKK